MLPSKTGVRTPGRVVSREELYANAHDWQMLLRHVTYTFSNDTPLHIGLILRASESVLHVV